MVFAYVSMALHDMGETIMKRIRRRGKKLVTSPYIAITNERNEFCKPVLQRDTPFRSASTDVGQNWGRCNLDFQFMPRTWIVPGGSSGGLVKNLTVWNHLNPCGPGQMRSRPRPRYLQLPGPGSRLLPAELHAPKWSQMVPHGPKWSQMVPTDTNGSNG
jgi:hypothetical protein